MRIVVFAPGDRKPQVRTIDGSLASMQSVVGGYLETVRLPDGNVLVCNEEGRIRNLEPNRLIDGHVYYGYFFICRVMDNKLVSITLVDAKRYLFNCRWPMAQQAGAAIQASTPCQ